MSSPVIPEHIRAAIHAGHVALVVVFCDRCGVEDEGDYTGETKEVRLAAARRHLGEQGWLCNADGDLCPACRPPAEELAGWTHRQWAPPGSVFAARAFDDNIGSVTTVSAETVGPLGYARLVAAKIVEDGKAADLTFEPITAEEYKRAKEGQ